MNKFIIEKGIAIPPNRAGSGELKSTLAALSVGDSFIHPSKKIRSSLGNYGKLLCMKFISRKLEGSEAIRIWRTA